MADQPIKDPKGSNCTALEPSEEDLEKALGEITRRQQGKPGRDFSLEEMREKYYPTKK